MDRIDLHIHTTASDGTFTPEEVVREASRIGLAAVAITDHDTAAGYARAAAEGENCGLEVVPGIEISTKFRSAVHILGYYIDAQSPDARALRRSRRAAAFRRNHDRKRHGARHERRF